MLEVAYLRTAKQNKQLSNMTTYEQTFDLLENTGLNWTVNKLPLVGPDGQKTDSYGIFRNDSGGWLGTVGPRYTPMQNSDLAETIIDACEGVGIEAKRGGSLRGGQRVYIQAQLTDEYIGRSGVKRYITALNSHDGTTAIAFGSTNTVVICENTFHMAYKSGGLTRFLHTASAKARIEAAMKELRDAMTNEQKLIDNYKRMADVTVEEGMVRRILLDIIKKGFGADENEKLSTRRTNQLVSLNSAIEREFVDEGPTLWGLFNGVTRYTNHIAAPKAEKMDYLMNGAGYDLNLVAYDAVMNWIEQHTAKQYVVA